MMSEYRWYQIRSGHLPCSPQYLQQHLSFSLLVAYRRCQPSLESFQGFIVYPTRCTSLRRPNSPVSLSARYSMVFRPCVFVLNSFVKSILSGIVIVPFFTMCGRIVRFWLSHEGRDQVGTRGLHCGHVLVRNYIHRNPFPTSITEIPWQRRATSRTSWIPVPHLLQGDQHRPKSYVPLEQMVGRWHGEFGAKLTLLGDSRNST